MSEHALNTMPALPFHVVLRQIREQQKTLLSISLDPLTDTPQVLKTVARRMGADLSSWSFVTY